LVEFLLLRRGDVDEFPFEIWRGLLWHGMPVRIRAFYI
jgi:hypothetical protein